MDVTSYLLGKNASGGGGTDLNNYFVTTISKGTNNKPYAINMIKNLPSTITVSGTSLDYSFSYCGNLKAIPYMDTSNVTSFNYCFRNCYAIETFPILDFSNAKNLSSVWVDCNSLTDTSLDNILQTLISATSYTGTKALTSVGSWVTSIYPASRWQALPHYQDFIDAGWTIGY
jgi:hypothetical protein